MWICTKSYGTSLSLCRCPLISLISLIPKVPNADRVSLYKPISCCTVIYEIMSNILSHKIKIVIEDVVDLSQLRFILGRQLRDNVLLANKLIKDCGRKYMTPRCMINIDMKKA